MAQSTSAVTVNHVLVLPIGIGVDIGDRQSDICVRDTAGEVVQQTRVPTTKAAIRRFFEQVEPGRVAMEVGTHSAWIEREISNLGRHQVFVANARKLRAIWDSDKKNDSTDASLLAEFVQLKPTLLRPIKHRGEEARNDLKLILARDALVRSRALLVNHVRGAVKATGARMPKCDADAFHKTVDVLPEELALALAPIVTQIGTLTALIKGYDKEISKRAATDPAVPLVSQVSGVGDLVALAFTSTIEDTARFPKTRNVGSYLGLRPRLDESGDTKKQLRITKAGSPYMRKLLVNSAQYILGPRGPDCDLKRFGLRIAERGGKNAKKRAAIAIARKLSVLMLTLWKTGGVYDPLRQAKTGAAKMEVLAPSSVESVMPKQEAVIEQKAIVKKRVSKKATARRSQ